MTGAGSTRDEPGAREIDPWPPRAPAAEWQVTGFPTVTAVAVPQDGERVRLALMGEVDLDSAGHVHQAVLNALRRYGPAELELDLAEVEFLDAAGVRALLACQADAERVGCRLTALNLLPTVRRVLEITGTLALLGGAARADHAQADHARADPARADHVA